MSVSLKLKPNAKARVLHGHPWVFANEVEALLPAAHDGEHLEAVHLRHSQVGQQK